MSSTGNAQTGASTLAPTRKVSVAGLAGALSLVIVFVMNTYVLGPDKKISPEFSAALTTILSAGIAWLVPPGQNEAVVG